MSACPESNSFSDEQSLPCLGAVSDLVEIAGRLRASSVIVPGGNGYPSRGAKPPLPRIGGESRLDLAQGGRFRERPFTPCRAGQLPLGELIDICYSGRFTRDELVRELTGNGGLRSYLGEHRMEVIEKRIAEGDQLAERVVAAMVYQIGKGIGAAYVAAGCAYSNT